MRKVVYTDGKWKLPFIARLPKVMKKGLPIIIQLHGAGERGDGPEELDLVEVLGFTNKVFTDDAELDCILVMPQCSKQSFWIAKIETIHAFIEQVVEEFGADRSRIYLVGISMGAFGTWFTASAYPKMFAAIAPVSGGCRPTIARAFLRMPVWAFHGDKDDIVPFNNTADAVKALQGVNDDVRFTVLNGVKHNAWYYTFDKELYDWLLQHRLKGEEK